MIAGAGATSSGAGDAAGFAQGASALLRRAALARYARAEVAPLCGESWLAFLDRSGRTSAFTGGAGRALVLAPYDPAASCDQDAPLSKIAPSTSSIRR